MHVARVSTLIGIAGLILTALVSRPVAAQSDVIPNQYIVVYDDAVADAAGKTRRLVAQHGFAPLHTYSHALKGFAAVIPPARLAQIQADPEVAFVQQDRIATLTSQQLPTGVNRIEADRSSTVAGDGSGTVGVDNSGATTLAVAVIDSGSTHSDLNVVGGYNCAGGSTSSYKDGRGHGTHVAGSIGAKDNGVGVVGVAPGVPIYSVRVVSNGGSSTISNMACGVDWVTANEENLKIKVANMSIGLSGTDDENCGNSNNDALHRAICGSVGAGVTYVVAAGNSTADIQNNVPAAYNEVLTVTAIADSDGQLGGVGAKDGCLLYNDDTAAGFSNFAVTSDDQAHTIAAPGVCIRSTWNDGGYRNNSGTSMAAPHVAGAAALCIASGQCTGGPSNIISKLRSDARDRADSTSLPYYYGFAGDPNRPNSTRYYGYLVYAGGY